MQLNQPHTCKAMVEAKMWFAFKLLSSTLKSSKLIFVCYMSHAEHIAVWQKPFCLYSFRVISVFAASVVSAIWSSQRQID